MNIQVKKKMMMKNLKMKKVIQVLFNGKMFSYEESQNKLKYLDESENLGSDEESGKSWSELEEEARKGNEHFSDLLFSIIHRFDF